MMKKWLEKIDYSNPDNKHKMNDNFYMLMEYTKENDEVLYNHIKCDMYEIVYGKKLNEDMAEEWTKSMQPIGKHWTMEETTNAMQSLGYNCDRIDYFVVANMMYNDYYDLVKEDETLALKMAYDFLNDTDAKSDKLYEYWKHIAKRD